MLVQGWVRQGPREMLLLSSLWMVTYSGRAMSPPSLMRFSSNLSILGPEALEFWLQRMNTRGQTDGWAILAT